MYSKIFGFKTASIMDYNMEYDHDDIAKNHSNPQVAYMVNTDENVETKQFAKNEYMEAVNYRDSFVNKATSNEVAFSIPKNNADYMKAAESGDTKTAQMSERFNDKNDDIRYSITTDTQKELFEKYKSGELNDDEYMEAVNNLYDKANEEYGSIKQGELVTGELLLFFLLCGE